MMHFFEWILLLTLLIGLPVMEAMTHKKVKRQLLARPVLKTLVYKQNIVLLWVPAAVLLALYWTSNLSVNDIGLVWPDNTATWIGLGFLLLYICYGLYLILVQANTDAGREKLLNSLQSVSWILPDTKRQTLLFCVGLSVTAGITEELLFRGYLVNWFAQGMPLWAAMLLSCLVFGLLHMYQGIAGVAKTAAMGGIFCLMYWWTGSLLLPILWHIWQDVFAGWLHYRLQNPSTPAGVAQAG